jgi:hypothetical protein
MTHAHGSILRRLSSSASHVAIAAACLVGCSDGVSSNGADDDLGSVTEALTDRHQEVMIHYLDPRTSTWFQISATATEQTTGGFFGGVATVPGSVTPRTLNSMIWTQNGMTEGSYDPSGGAVSLLWFDDFSDLPYQFTPMRVTVQATINGKCHTDWEDITLVQNGAVHLKFDGNGAHWNGSCFTGDLLKHYF